MSAQPRVLVVEDETAIQELLHYSLVQAGFDVVLVASAEEAAAEVARQLPTIVLLDLMLPGISGPTFARRLRTENRTRELPIIMVTAKAEEGDRIRGLELGADDYVTKPFSPKELVARIRAVLRRRTPHMAGETLEVGPLRLDPSSHTVTVEGVPVSLGPTDFELLQFLMNYPNRVYTRDQLLNALRGDHRFVEDRTVDVYIRRLRAGLGPSGHRLIETVRGLGYKLNAPAS
jgi:two-component system phosphate regulon response regulator PhoB